MALLVLIILGATIGWLASIVARTEAVGVIMRQIGVGSVVSLLAGLLSNSGSPFGGLSMSALAIASLAAIVALVLYHAVLGRREDAEA